MPGSFACRICGNEQDHQVHTAPEMALGRGETFAYVECGACGCLQIREVPANLSRYYLPDHDSLSPYDIEIDGPFVQFLKRQRALHSLGLFSLGGALAAKQFGVPEYYEWLRRGHVRLEHSILDVGSGAGRLLHQLQREGFTHLTGIEPHAAEDVQYPNGVRVLKKSLEELEPGFDLLLFHHSFEHLPDPLTTLRHAHRLLNPDRYAVLRIPVAGSYAWRQYGVHWVQLDAPRHLYLHTPRSIQILADQAGFRIEEVVFDSTEFQFWGSEAYREGKSLASLKDVPGTDAELEKYRQRAEELNRRGEGDQATFYLFRH